MLFLKERKRRERDGTKGSKRFLCMHGADLRWLVVFKRCQLNYGWSVIEEELHISISSQKRIVECYETTGQVFRRSAKKRGRPRALNAVQAEELIKRVLDSPKVNGSRKPEPCRNNLPLSQLE